MTILNRAKDKLHQLLGRNTTELGYNGKNSRGRSRRKDHSDFTFVCRPPPDRLGVRLRVLPIALDEPNALRADRVELAVTTHYTSEVDADDHRVKAVVGFDIHMNLVAEGLGELTTAKRASRLVDRTAVRDKDVIDVQRSCPVVVKLLAIGLDHGAVETKLRLLQEALKSVRRVREDIRQHDAALGSLSSLRGRRLGNGLRPRDSRRRLRGDGWSSANRRKGRRSRERTNEGTGRGELRGNSRRRSGGLASSAAGAESLGSDFDSLVGLGVPFGLDVRAVVDVRAVRVV
jgi:hypothetical protein